MTDSARCALIVVHVDLTDQSIAAVEYGRALATAFGSSLRFVHVVREPRSAVWTATSALPEVQQAMEVEAEQWLDRVLPEDEQDRFQASLDVETGDVSTEIVRVAEEQGADVVVMSAPKDGGGNGADIAEDVVRKCRCSVMVVR